MRKIARLIVAAAAFAAIAVAFWNLHGASAGLTITTADVGAIPVTVFRPASSERAPVVVIAHGFAGSQQLMQQFATTLARNGYVAVTFDFPGHGRNPTPFAGGISNDALASRHLLAALGDVTEFARALPEGDGRLAMVGHSMGSDIVVRFTQAHPEVAATVAVSVFAPHVAADSPRDLQVVVGGWEPPMLHTEGQRIVGMAAGGGPVTEGVTYGSIADGTARRFMVSPGVEHIGVIYSRNTLAATLDWLNTVFDRHQAGFIDARGPWLGLLFLGLVALGWPLAGLLPHAAARPLGAGLRWRRLLPVALVPAMATPLLLWKLPTDFLPLLLGDYLSVHFALYGLLTAAGLWLVRRRYPDARHPDLGPPRVSYRALAIAAGAVAFYGIVAIGLPVNAYATSFLPVPVRMPLILAMLAGTLPWYLADEWLTRGPNAPRGAYAATKLFFLLSVAAAIALNLHRLFFLIIIVPVILVFFIIFGLFSTWTYRATRHPLAAAIGNAAVLAWAIAVTFPLVAR